MTITLSKPPSLNSIYRYTSRGGKTWMYMARSGHDWMEEAGWELKREKCPKFGTREVSLYVKIYHCGRTDYDNMLKLLGDLLTDMKIVEDDSQITFVQIEKIKVKHRKDEKLTLEIVANV